MCISQKRDKCNAAIRRQHQRYAGDGLNPKLHRVIAAGGPGKEKMRDVFVIGVGHTAFGKFLERNIKSLTEEAVTHALKDARIEKGDLESAFFGNAMQGVVTGQEMVRGQIALRHSGIDGIPITNCENACATGATAFHLAWQSISGGHVDVALAVGAAKLYMVDTAKMFKNYDVSKYIFNRLRTERTFIEYLKSMRYHQLLLFFQKCEAFKTKYNRHIIKVRDYAKVNNIDAKTVLL